jgi:hypothetical protein
VLDVDLLDLDVDLLDVGSQSSPRPRCWISSRQKKACEGIKSQPHKCFSVGAGHLGIDLSEQAFAPYRSKGFDLKNLCMVLTSGQIRFDPETGQRLPTYVIIHHYRQNDGTISNFASDELLFYAPPCFARGKITRGNLFAQMKPLGCTVEYHPWSGRKLSSEESRFFTENALLIVAGDAGDLAEDSKNLAKDSARVATSASIEAIKKQAGMK